MTRQIVLFVAAGVLQYGVDVALFSLLFFFGADIWVANVTARGTAAIGGFLFNGLVTFGQERGNRSLGVHHLLRFVGLWCALTVVSTSLLGIARSLAESSDLAVTWIIAAKVIVEVGMAVVSFVASKWWVYANKPRMPIRMSTRQG